MKRVLARQESGRIEFCKRTLIQKRTETLSNLGIKFDTLASMGRIAEDDQASISHDEFISLSLNSLDYQQLRLVEEALDRIRTGDYGLCLACGDPIPEKRLNAVPWARFCVTCQDRQGMPAPRDVDSTEFTLGR